MYTFLTDNIESNIVSTEANVKAGTGELRKASDYQKSSRKKLCWLLLCLIILVGGLSALIYIFAK